LTKICHQIGLKVSKIRELKEGGEVKSVAGSPEIKGIRGTDRRRYIIDLMRLNPRDYNYPDPISNSCCLIREEAIKVFNL
jgi:hypothetical protein